MKRRRRCHGCAFDYHFMNDEGEEQVSMLTMMDSSTGAVWMRVAESKGCSEKNEWVVRALVEELEEWGYRGKEVIIRRDQEPSIEAVKGKVVEYRTGKTIPEENAVGESKRNGRVEEAGKRVRDQAQVLKDQVEYRCGGKVKTDSDVMQWLIRWAAMVQTSFKVGAKETTAWLTMKGRKCELEVLTA